MVAAQSIKTARSFTVCVKRVLNHCASVGLWEQSKHEKNTMLFYRTDEQLWQTSQIMRGCFGLLRLMLTIVTMRGMSTSTTAIQTTTIRTTTILFGWCADESDTCLFFDEHFCLASCDYSPHFFRNK